MLSLTVNDDKGLTVELSISSLNVAVIREVIGTPVALSVGIVLATVGEVLSSAVLKSQSQFEFTPSDSKQSS
jgi:hypothetical protein